MMSNQRQTQGKLRKMRQGTTIFSIIVVVIFVYIVNIIIKNNNKNDLKENWVLGNGVLLKVKLNGRSADFAEYTYTVGGKEYTGEYFREVQTLYKEFYNLKPHKWTVIYDSTDYSNSALLLRREDFDYWAVPYSGQNVADF